MTVTSPTPPPLIDSRPQHHRTTSKLLGPRRPETAAIIDAAPSSAGPGGSLARQPGTGASQLRSRKPRLPSLAALPSLPSLFSASSSPPTGVSSFKSKMARFFDSQPSNEATTIFSSSSSSHSRRASQSEKSEADSTTACGSPETAKDKALQEEIQSLNAEARMFQPSATHATRAASGAPAQPARVPKMVRNKHNNSLIDTSFIPALEGMRGIAVLFVIASHVWPQPGGLFLWPWLLGICGVTTFFVLSGWLITGILLSSQLPRFRHLPLFFANRTVRLTPSLWLVAGVTTFIWINQGRGFHTIKEHLLTVLLYAENQFSTQPGHRDMIMAHGWTLAVEEQFYLVWAFCVPFFAARRPVIRMALLALVICVSYAFKYRWATMGEVDMAHKSLTGNAFSLIFGSALRLAPQPLPAWIRSQYALLAGSAMYVTAVLCMWLKVKDNVAQLWVPVVITVATGHIIEGSAAVGNRFLEMKVWRRVGRVSYSLYLWHHVLLWFPGLFNRLAVDTMGVAIGSYAIADVSTIYFEEPLRNWAKNLPWFKAEAALGRTAKSTEALLPSGQGYQSLTDAIARMIPEPANAPSIPIDKAAAEADDWSTSMTNADIAKLGYIPALEGLRGLAVLLPIACHIHGGAPRDFLLGSLGVTVFFTLSGFLITGVLLSLQLKYRSYGNPYAHLVRFYADRNVRLVPPLFLLVVVGSHFWIRQYGLPDVMFLHALRAMLNLENTLLLRPDHGPDSPFRNVWSLGVEEQFYVLWAFALPHISARGIVARRNILFAILSLSLVCRLWFGRDTINAWGPSVPAPWLVHWHESLASNLWKMLIGCSMRLLPLPGIMTSSAAGYFGIALLGVAIVTMQLPLQDMSTMWNFTGDSMAVASAVFMIAGSLRGNSLLENKVLRFLGRISYSWYLWQVPIIWLDHTWQSDYKAVTSSCLALVIAMASTFLVEEPIRNRYREWLKQASSVPLLTPPSPRISSLASSSSSAARQSKE